MPLSLAYWILMFVWLLGGFYWGSTLAGPGRYSAFGGSILIFLLFLILGMRLFGAPISG